MKLVIAVAIFEQHLWKGPRLRSAMPNAVHSPMNANTKLHILKCFIGARWSRMILRNGHTFDIRFVPERRGWKAIDWCRGLPETRVDRRGCQGRGGSQKISAIHRGSNGTKWRATFASGKGESGHSRFFQPWQRARSKRSVLIYQNQRRTSFREKRRIVGTVQCGNIRRRRSHDCSLRRAGGDAAVDQ